MTDEELFYRFLEEYLNNVSRELPQSFRARQLRAGSLSADAVFEFETRFLKEPFLKAIRKARGD